MEETLLPENAERAAICILAPWFYNTTDPVAMAQQYDLSMSISWRRDASVDA